MFLRPSGTCSFKMSRTFLSAFRTWRQSTVVLHCTLTLRVVDSSATSNAQVQRPALRCFFHTSPASVSRDVDTLWDGLSGPWCLESGIVADVAHLVPRVSRWPRSLEPYGVLSPRACEDFQPFCHHDGGDLEHTWKQEKLKTRKMKKKKSQKSGKK